MNIIHRGFLKLGLYAEEKAFSTGLSFKETVRSDHFFASRRDFLRYTGLIGAAASSPLIFDMMTKSKTPIDLRIAALSEQIGRLSAQGIWTFGPSVERQELIAKHSINVDLEYVKPLALNYRVMATK